MRHTILITIFILLNIAACTPPTSVNLQSESIIKLTKGIWYGALDIGSDSSPLEIPFNFEVIDENKIVIRNGDEHIEVTDINYDNNNSISIKMPVFGSEFKLTNHKNGWEGNWHNYNKKDYKIPFKAVKNNKNRFAALPSTTTTKLAPRWKVTFSPNTDDSYPAIGLFNLEEKGKVTGTFLTETGDYRYLEGIFDGKELSLSCFDGAHAFLFKATLQEDGSLKGDFWSGNHWHEQWQAEPNTDFQLASMDKLTHLKEGYDKLAFRFPNASGDTISLEDKRFEGKPTIVQITGSWCPNCMDETRFLVDVYDKYHPKGLEIIAIDYEVVNDFEVFKKSKARIQKHLGVNYPFVFGGPAKKSEAIKTLPMLNHIMSYPTAIFIDKKGQIREIHTGFSGPGTGDLYQKYVDKTIALVEELVAE
ncbi:peroxiredoxin family protein [Aureispira anguillae]|uniref:TlpA family protein disulfide reductase n=1 Tax=Aureispira anguillae TaxID=2864201 RepID=A0A915YI41_9BACT|nr:TlpA disulfide reductase family protein [Aureispira anguillae]BDS13589.1 TlpA family protein disulfide reductase [Aureispira anguillae]